jgi:L-threonylcarbamoyladenylate synthase
MLLNLQKILKNQPPCVSATLLAHLRKGGVLFAPTDTVFGILCLEEKKICEIKKKTARTPLQLLATEKIAYKFLAQEVIENKVFLLLAKNFWPGALSLIAQTIMGKRECFRVPDNGFLLKILSLLDEPIFASSLNLHGEEELWTRDRIIKFAKSTMHAVWVLYKKQNLSQASTIIDFYSHGPNAASFKIFRIGCLNQDQLLKPLAQAGYQITTDDTEMVKTFIVRPPLST